MIDLDALIKLEAKATPGPWEAYSETDSPKGRYLSGIKTLALVPYHEDVVTPYIPYENSGTCDAEFIAAMRNNIRALCEELKAARSALYFAQVLADSVIRYTDGDVTINMIHVEALRDYLEMYDEVCNAKP